MILESLHWLLVASSITGVILNIRHDPRCWIVWLVTNAAWTIVDLTHGIYSQAALQFVYFLLAIWGLVGWKQKRKGKS